MVVYTSFKRGKIMENNKFKQFCGSIDYNTYNKIQSILGFSSVGMALTNDLILSQYPVLNSSVDALAYLSIAAYLGLAWSHGKDYTRDIKQIRSLYQKFITNYNKLNKIFDLNDPIQIHTMFNYLLYKGYLSIDKNFEFSNKEARDINGLYGTNVITGKAVCRHISAMLTDILNNYGIESSQLGVYSMNYSVNINILEQPKYTKEELVNWVQTHITDEQTYSIVMKFIEELVDKRGQSIELSTKMIEDKNILKRKVGNHAITFSVKDGKSYYLDPTQTRIYRVSENDKNVLYDDEYDRVPIKLLSSIVLNDSKDYLRMREKLSQQYQSITREEEKQMIEQTITDCKNNMDIFEQFYNENSELYSDISSKVLRIKKRKTIVK